MGQLVNGEWKKEGPPQAGLGFRHRIGSDDFKAQAGRYHLYVSHRCPFAHAALIALTLKGLQEVVSHSAVSPQISDQGWCFGPGDTADPQEGSSYLYEIYLKADPHYSGRVTTPVLWDTQNKTIVNNESGDLIRIFNQDFGPLAPSPIDLEPETHKEAIHKWETLVTQSFMPTLMKCKQATGPDYTATSDTLKSILKTFEDRLSSHNYLATDLITRADIRFFAPLVRFDAVHLPAFFGPFPPVNNTPALAAFLQRLLKDHGLERTLYWKHMQP